MKIADPKLLTDFSKLHPRKSFIIIRIYSDTQTQGWNTFKFKGAP